MYPSSRPLSTPISEKGRTVWGPIFDKYNVRVAFENHDHTYKRTKKIKNGVAVSGNETGTIFLGDGCWGVNPRYIRKNLEDFYQVAQSKSYVLSASLNQTFFSFRALTLDGDTFDSFDFETY